MFNGPRWWRHSPPDRPSTRWVATTGPGQRRFLAHLPEVEDDAILRVALADRVHNARSVVRDYREEGHALWERFTQKTAREQLWYYGEHDPRAIDQLIAAIEHHPRWISAAPHSARSVRSGVACGVLVLERVDGALGLKERGPGEVAKLADRLGRVSGPG